MGGSSRSDAGGSPWPSEDTGYATFRNGRVTGDVHVAGEGRGPEDSFCEYIAFNCTGTDPPSIRPRWGDYGAAVPAAAGNPVDATGTGLYAERMAILRSVNVGLLRPAISDTGVSGIDKRPVDGPVMVRDPGPKGTGEGGLVGDHLGDPRHHGGHDQAVYAYAREDLDAWEEELAVPLASGVFGENLTTADLDVTGARTGERWRIGERVLLQVTVPRIPCRTFAGWMRRHGWVRTFTQRGVPGAYLRVLEPGWIRAGDPIVVEHRPDHQVTIGLIFRALTTEPELLPSLLEADDLPDDAKDRARRRLTFDVLS